MKIKSVCNEAEYPTLEKRKSHSNNIIWKLIEHKLSKVALIAIFFGIINSKIVSAATFPNDMVLYVSQVVETPLMLPYLTSVYLSTFFSIITLVWIIRAITLKTKKNIDTEILKKKKKTNKILLIIFAILAVVSFIVYFVVMENLL